jgi:RNA polymerase-binding transcription factor DksA
MLRTKDEIEQAQDDWNLKARSEGYRCEECGCTPPYEERSTYFDTRLCVACQRRLNKDD